MANRTGADGRSFDVRAVLTSRVFWVAFAVTVVLAGLLGVVAAETVSVSDSTTLVETETGTATVSGNGSLDLDPVEGTWTNGTNVSINTSITIDPDDKPAITVADNLTDIAYREEMTVGDGDVDFVYGGPLGTNSTITLRGLRANARIYAIDTHTGNRLSEIVETSSNGTATFELPNSQHSVELEGASSGEIAPYYDEADTSVDNESWLPSNNATLPSVLNLATRLGTFLVGTDAGGVGASGAILTGLIVFGAVVSLSSGSRVGAVGGAVLGMSTVAALVAAGLAPSWLWALVLFALGVVATAVIARALQ